MFEFLIAIAFIPSNSESGTVTSVSSSSKSFGIFISLSVPSSRTAKTTFFVSTGSIGSGGTGGRFSSVSDFVLLTTIPSYSAKPASGISGCFKASFIAGVISCVSDGFIVKET